MNDDWNFDMDAAPRGETRKVQSVIGKNTVYVDVHDAPKIFAADKGGEIVTLTRWLPKEGRWSMFSKDHPPIAWMPFPAHPGVPA